MGSKFTTALSEYYRNGRYRTAKKYRHRIETDLETSTDKIEQHTELKTRIIV